MLSDVVSKVCMRYHAEPATRTSSVPLQPSTTSTLTSSLAPPPIETDTLHVAVATKRCAKLRSYACAPSRSTTSEASVGAQSVRVSVTQRVLELAPAASHNASVRELPSGRRTRRVNDMSYHVAHPEAARCWSASRSRSAADRSGDSEPSSQSVSWSAPVAGSASTAFDLPTRCREMLTPKLSGAAL
eukprot:2488282-Prymnesium_polylepis.2